MHKAQNMSHGNITVPITVKYSARPGHLRAVSRADFLRNPETAKYRFVEDGSLPPLGPFDLWQLRQDFLSWPLDAWQGFVGKAGKFSNSTVSKEEFERWQKLLRFALICPTSEWAALGIDFHATVGFEWGGATPQVFMLASSALEAIVFTIQLDRLRGADFKVCARHDCKNPPFRVEARQKIFCSYECAHLVAVRRSRAGKAAKNERGK
jgi:hypothetical protein